MNFTGLILVDCWGGNWHNECPKADAFYSNMLSFVKTHVGSIEHLVITTYPNKFGTVDTRFFNIAHQHLHQNVFSWRQFKHFKLDTGNWLIAGAAWNVCIHSREIGVVAYTQSQLSCNLYSHKNLIDTDKFLSDTMTDSHFENDTRCQWQLANNGFYQVLGAG